MSDQKRHKIFYLVAEDWYFVSHRLPAARAARDQGLEVWVATRVRDHGDVITREGFRLAPVEFRRGSLNPFRDFLTFLGILALYRRERPDLVHHVGIKPILYGMWAARLARVPRAVNAFAGLGFLFSHALLARALRPCVVAAMRRLLDREGAVIVCQNESDMTSLRRLGIARSGNARLIRGSGVDVDRFRPSAEPVGPTVVSMVGRMLWSKGVGELIEAARILRDQGGTGIEIWLAGMPDPSNPDSIDKATLNGWQEDGLVKWLGHQDDIAGLWRKCHICALPTCYPEGVPKTLLEAAACGRPMVATDVPGCREVVRHGETGFLVPERDPNALAEAISTLAGSRELREGMGASARALICEAFSDAVVAREFGDLYRDVLNQPSRT